MRHFSRTALLASSSASAAAALVSVAVLSAPRGGMAQDNPQAAAPQLAPMLGGKVPVPDHFITITWNPLIKSARTRAALVGQYYVVEGDMIVGTVDDVTKAQRNAIAARADRFLKSGGLTRYSLPDDVRKSAAELIQRVAEQPREQTSLTTEAAGEADFVRLLQEIQQFQAAHRTRRSRAPDVAGTDFTKDASEALTRFETASRKSAAPGGPVAPAPEGDPNQQGIAEAFGVPIGSPFLWPNGVVPYYIDPSYEPYRGYFERACALWTAQTTAVSFRPYQSGDRNYLYVHLIGGDAGSSTVGRNPGGAQWMNLLHLSRFPESHISHELGHALGLFHEQSRPDSASFLSLITTNIDRDWLSQFTAPTQPSSTLGTGFDYFSVMLYDTRAGSVNPMASAGPYPYRPAYPVYSIPQAWKDYYLSKYNFRLDTDVIGLGNTRRPSRQDVAAVNKLYAGPSAAPAAVGNAPPPASPPGEAGAPATPPKPPGPAFPSHPASVGFVPGAPPASGLAAAASAPAPPGAPPGSAITVTVTIPYPAGPPTVGLEGQGGPVGPSTAPIGVELPSPPPAGSGGVGGPPPPAPPGFESAPPARLPGAPASPR